MPRESRAPNLREHEARRIFVGVSRRCRVDERKVALRSSMTCHTPLPNFAQLLYSSQFCWVFSLLFPLALLAALRGGRARVHEKEEVK